MNKILASVFWVFFFFFCFASEIKAWGGDIHSYLCPFANKADCTIADSKEFKIANNWDSFGHLCLDDQPDCLARLGAKYFLKKYYLSGEKDWQFLAAAAHLYQDASCPDHWYPMREFFGRIIVPFAPSWVATIEGRVSRSLSFRPGPSGTNDGWNIPISWQGREIDINKSYLEKEKESLKLFIASEPSEGIEEIKSQIDAKRTWTLVRSYKEMAILLWLIMVPAWLYTFYAFKKRGRRSDFLIVSLILGIVGLYLVVIQFLWRG